MFQGKLNMGVPFNEVMKKFTPAQARGKELIKEERQAQHLTQERVALSRKKSDK